MLRSVLSLSEQTSSNLATGPKIRGHFRQALDATNGIVIGGNGGLIEIISSNSHNNNTSITVGDINTSAKDGSAY
jgi:hypothetical protein